MSKQQNEIQAKITEIPAKEKWLFENKKALKKIDKGLKDAAAGRLSERVKFSKYINDDND